MATFYDLNESIEALKKYLEEQRKHGLISRKTYEELNKRIEEDNAALNDNTKQLLKNSKKSRELKAAAKSFVSSSLQGVQALRRNREDFRSLNPAVKAATSAAQVVTSATGQFLKTVGDAASTFSIFGGPLVKALGAIGGGGLSVLGTVMDENAKQTAALANAFGQFALQELQNVVEAYREIGSVGGITAEGMNGVYNDAIRAGMSVKDYSQLMATEGANLSFFAGSVTDGAKALGDVSQANEAYKEEYLKLGYTYADQQKFTAEYLRRNRLLNGTSIEDTDKLAEGSREYMDLLNDIAGLTGQSRDAAAQELAEQQSNVRFQATQRIVTKKTGSDKIAKEMSLVASGIKAFAGPGLAEGFMDLTGGLGTKAAEDFNAATGGEGQRITEMLKSGEIDANKALQMYQEAARRQQKNVGADNFIATVGNTNNILAKILPEQTRFVHAQDITVENINKTRKRTEEGKKSKDQETENITKAQAAMRKMGMEFDKIVQDRVFPLATDAVDEFTDLVVDFVNTAGKTLGFANKVVRKVRGKPETSKTLMQEGAEHPGSFTGADETNGPLVDKKTGKLVAPGKGAVGGADETTSPFVDEKTGKTIAPGEGLEGKSLTGVQPTLAGRIEQVAREFKARTGGDINVTSAVRTPEEQEKLYNDYISGKSKYPAAPPGRSKHDRGLAIDVDSSIANKLDSMGLLAKYGLGRPVSNDPVHIEVVSAASGGMFSGPQDGYPAVLHGTEAIIPMGNSSKNTSGPKTNYNSPLSNSDAVVPLPNGTDIPVKTSGLDESAAQQIKTIRYQNQIINEIIMAARVNNDANKRILSLKSS